MRMVALRTGLIAFGFDPKENDLAFDHGGSEVEHGDLFYEGRDENKKMVAFERSEAIAVMDWRGGFGRI
ncbi:hypothetical protein SLEP1_g46624 [Rubroshorea leprosula]|uniref:Uncharacterized protein n=1 Tax=Rubroshorea leprosula TaxID=152421 RepID=A0AAV5LNS0_9ROSI|nr:hypothetical protein SLEP1_g46624 [Rubroshorea leprosula]